MELTKISQPFCLTIFGASGDLAKLKVFPSLYSLMEQKRFPADFYIVGFARTKKERSQFQAEFEQSVRDAQRTAPDETVLQELLQHVYYFTGDYSDQESFRSLRLFWQKLSPRKPVVQMAYFSVPPVVFKDIIQNLAVTRTQPDEDLRLVLEKPFGEDMASAQELFYFTLQYFPEEHLYLLDHFLGKTAVRSILFLRRYNKILELLLKGGAIANIQITYFESLGVGSRAGYFDQVGVSKDMVQSHLLQILSLLVMEIPITDSPESFHREKYKILSSLLFTGQKNGIVLGQYQSYTQEKNVPESSQTETFAALRFSLDTESWEGVPIYIRTGKKMLSKSASVVIEFKKFGFQKTEEPNRLVIEFAPEEKICMSLLNKHGGKIDYNPTTLSDSLACTGDECLPNHAVLLLDALQGDKMYFLSFQEVMASWKIIDVVLKHVATEKVPRILYPDGSRGPREQQHIPQADGFEWYEFGT